MACVGSQSAFSGLEVDKTIDDFVHIIITVLGSPSGWRPSLETSPGALEVELIEVLRDE